MNDMKITVFDSNNVAIDQFTRHVTAGSEPGSCTIHICEGGVLNLHRNCRSDRLDGIGWKDDGKFTLGDFTLIIPEMYSYWLQPVEQNEEKQDANQ